MAFKSNNVCSFEDLQKYVNVIAFIKIIICFETICVYYKLTSILT